MEGTLVTPEGSGGVFPSPGRIGRAASSARLPQRKDRDVAVAWTKTRNDEKTIKNVSDINSIKVQTEERRMCY